MVKVLNLYLSQVCLVENDDIRDLRIHFTFTVDTIYSVYILIFQVSQNSVEITLEEVRQYS